MAGLSLPAVLPLLAVLPVSSARAAVGYPGVLENDIPPTVGGDVEVGGAAVASPGDWSGQGPISYTYQWLVLMAGGSARIRRLGPGVVQIKATARGRKLVKRSRSLTLTAVATVVPTQSLAVSAIAPFGLT